MKQVELVTEIGPLFLVASDRGLAGVHWTRRDTPMIEPSDRGQARRFLDLATTELRAYFKGELERFTVPLDPVGTTFQKKVWRELARIPYGKTLAYREVATRIEHARAFRAVGTANGRNPLSIIVPCHRVIASDGTLGGYAGGLAIKRRLLDIERGRIGARREHSL